MVSTTAIIGIIFTMLISFVVPILLAVILYKRHRYNLLSLVVGAAVFVISQILIRIPLLSLVSTTSWHQRYSSSIVYLLFVYALSAGIFEESGRFIGFRFFRKNHLDWRNAVAVGIGHGGIEAMLLAGMQSVNNLIVSIMINNGSFSQVIAPGLGEQVEQVETALTTTPVAHFFYGGLERLAVMPIHIALSVLVCLAVVKRKYLLVLLAILLHGIVNTPAALTTPFDIDLIIIEGLIVLMGIIAIWAVFKMKSHFNSFKTNQEDDS